MTSLLESSERSTRPHSGSDSLCAGYPARVRTGERSFSISHLGAHSEATVYPQCTVYAKWAWPKGRATSGRVLPLEKCSVCGVGPLLDRHEVGFAVTIAMPKGETSDETLEQSCMAGTEAADSAILRDGKGLRTPRTLSGTLVGSSKADTELASARTKIINALDDKDGSGVVR